MQQTGKVSDPNGFSKHQTTRKSPSLDNPQDNSAKGTIGPIAHWLGIIDLLAFFLWESNCYKCKSIFVIFIVVDLADSLTLIFSKYLFLTKSLEKILQGLYLLEISNFYTSSEKKSQGSKNVENFLAKQMGWETICYHLDFTPVNSSHPWTQKKTQRISPLRISEHQSWWNPIDSWSKPTSEVPLYRLVYRDPYIGIL